MATDAEEDLGALSAIMQDDVEVDDPDPNPSESDPKPNALSAISRDLTSLPAELDAKYLEVDPEGMLRPTVIKVDPDRHCSKVSIRCTAVRLGVGCHALQPGSVSGPG